MKIIDNVLPDNVFKDIQDVFLGNTFSWYYMSSVEDSIYNDGNYYFSSVIYNNCAPTTNLFQKLFPVLDVLQPKALVRIKANLYPNINKFVTHKPHKDYEYKHNGAIFYLNTNNGYTILEDGTKVESVANRLLMFDASENHSSTNCTDTQARVNINFNYF